MARKPTVLRAAVAGEARVALSSLSQWLNVSLRSGRPLPRRAYNVERLRPLCETLGILSFQGVAREVTCQECEDPHPAIVNHHCGRYAYNCLLNGEIELHDDDIRLFAIDRDAFLDALANATNLAARNRISYAEGRLVRLGFVSDEDRIWPLAYADDLARPNVFAAVQETIEKQFPDGPGLIATPSRVHLNMPLHRSYGLIPLHELFFGQANQIMLDREVALIRLGRRKKSPGVPGRPTEREETRRIRSDFLQRDQWPSGRAAQVQLIEENWPDGGPQIPAPKTIEAHLRAFENED